MRVAKQDISMGTVVESLTIDIKVTGVFEFKIRLAIARILVGLLGLVVSPAKVRFRVYEQGRDRAAYSGPQGRAPERKRD
jgi:hypothetical protein